MGVFEDLTFEAKANGARDQGQGSLRPRPREFGAKANGARGQGQCILRSVGSKVRSTVSVRVRFRVRFRPGLTNV